jgi:hypothetical protein
MFVLRMNGLSHSSLKRYGEELLCLYSEFHREFVDYILGVAVDDETYGILCRYASLIAVE